MSLSFINYFKVPFPLRIKYELWLKTEVSDDEDLANPAYSPDVAPSDCHLF